MPSYKSAAGTNWQPSSGGPVAWLEYLPAISFGTGGNRGKSAGRPKYFKIRISSASLNTTATGTNSFLQLLSLFIGTVVHLFIFAEPAQKQFNRKIWLDPGREECARYAMRQDLFGTYKLVGMAEAEVVELLGVPDDRYFFRYKLGPQPGAGIDSIWLELTFSNGQVRKYSLVHA